MIASKKDKDPSIRDNFGYLAGYLADTANRGEKLEHLWIAGCDAGDTADDLKHALNEIDATRRLKSNIANKTYHLVVSLAPGESLSAEQWQDVERSMAEAIGFQDHQRVAAVHSNTDHQHMHVAYNKVHPETLKVITPWNDYRKLEAVCREMEKKYGLEVVKSMHEQKDKMAVHGKARDFETNTWQQSFQGFLLEHREELLDTITEATNWADLHRDLAAFGVGFKRYANGLVLAELDGDQHMKASALDRSCSKPALEKRLGAFQPPRRFYKAPPPQDKDPRRDRGRSTGRKTAYRRKPLTRHPATNALWQRYTGAAKVKSPSLTGRFMANWKLFLLSEAYYEDPLALVVVMAQQEMIDLMLGLNQRKPQGSPSRPRPVPKIARPALQHWIDQAEWTEWQHPKDKRSAPLKPDKLDKAMAKAQWSEWQQPKDKAAKRDKEALARATLYLFDQEHRIVAHRDADGHIEGFTIVNQDGHTVNLGTTRPLSQILASSKTKSGPELS